MEDDASSSLCACNAGGLHVVYNDQGTASKYNHSRPCCAVMIVLSFTSYRSVVSISEPAQIVPAMDERKRDAELMVPDQQEDNPPMATDASLASNIDMNAVRLTLSPILLAESHASHVIHSPATTNGTLLGSPYGSPSAGHLFPYVLTAEVQPHLSHPRASSNGNPFICCPSPAPGILSGSPTHSLNSTSPTSRGPVSFLPSSPSYSYPPPTFVSQRHPLALSLSSDSYFSPASAFHSHLRSQSLISPISSASHLENSLEAQSVVSSNQSVMESLVTFRSPSHGIGTNRHSYSDGDVLNASSLLSPYHFSYQRRRRNSSGSERLRRHSHGTHGNHSNSLGDASSLHRTRRRSHDARDEPVELLENLRVAATSPRTSNITPSQFHFVPIRVLSPTENP